jgi:hypothetical protein
MKLRIRGDSIRLRLTQTEVSTLAAGGTVEMATHFAPGQRLVCALTPSPAATMLSAILHGGRLQVLVPGDRVQAWARSNDVSMSAEQHAGPETKLSILIEKDFQCLTHRGEDDADAYPHPAAGATNC